MATIAMTRVDARLVHGQVAGRWIKTLDVKRIVIVEDEVANDPFMVELFKLTSPPGTKIICYNQANGLAEYEKSQFGNGRIILLFKYLESADKAWRAGIKFEALNVAQVPGGPGRSLAVQTVSLSIPELEVLEGLDRDGVRVYFQAIPDDKQTPLETVSKKLRG